MRFPRLTIVASLLGVIGLAWGAPAWAGGRSDVDTSGFGSALGPFATSSSMVPSSNPCLGSTGTCTTTIYNVDMTSQVFQNGSVFTYVYGIKLDDAFSFSCPGGGVTCTTSNGTKTVTPLTLASITIGSPNFDITGLFFGVVTHCLSGNCIGVSTSGGTSISGAALSSSSLQFTPTGLSVGSTLLVYAQSNQGGFLTGGSTQDGGNVASSQVYGPTPEPTSIALLGSGLILVGGVIRRRLRRRVG